MWAVVGLWYATCQSGGGFKGRPVNRVPTQVYGAAVDPAYEIAYTVPYKTEQSKTKRKGKKTQSKRKSKSKSESIMQIH